MNELFLLEYTDGEFVITRYVVEGQTREFFQAYMEDYPGIPVAINKRDVTDGGHGGTYYWSLEQAFEVELACAHQDLELAQEKVNELETWISLLEDERDERL